MFTSAPAASASMGLCVFCDFPFGFPQVFSGRKHTQTVLRCNDHVSVTLGLLCCLALKEGNAVSPCSCLRRLQSSPRTFGLSGGWNSKFAKLPRRNRLCLFAAAAAATGQTKKTWWKNSHFLILLQLLLLLRPYRRPCDLGCRSLMIGMRKLPTWESRK